MGTGCSACRGAVAGGEGSARHPVPFVGHAVGRGRPGDVAGPVVAEAGRAGPVLAGGGRALRRSQVRRVPRAVPARSWCRRAGRSPVPGACRRSSSAPGAPTREDSPRSTASRRSRVARPRSVVWTSAASSPVVLPRPPVRASGCTRPAGSAPGVDPRVGVHAEALRVPAISGDAARAEQVDQHVHGLGGCDLRSTIRWGSWRRVTGAGVSAWLTSGRRAGVADDEHGRVVADKAPVAVLGGERDRAPRVARGLRGVPGSDHGGEADRDVGAPAPPLEGPGARGAVDGRPPRAVRLEAAEGGGPLACTTRSGLRSRSKRLNLPQEAVVLRGRRPPGADRTLVGCRRPGAPAGRSAGDGRHRGGALTGHVRPAGCSTLRAGGSGTPSADVNPPRYPRPAPATRPRRGVDRPLPSLCPFPVTCGLFRSAGW